MVLIKIALRNIFAHKKRSAMIGAAILISCLFILLSASTMNGVQQQVLKGYMNIQSGHVAVEWEEQYKISGSDAGKFSENGKTYDLQKDAENKVALRRLDTYLQQHEDEIKAFYPTLHRNAYITEGSSMDYVMLYGITEASGQFFSDTKTVETDSGTFEFKQENDLYLSKEKLVDNNLKVGDTIAIDYTSAEGEAKSANFRVAGAYANGAGYNNIYAYMSDSYLRELLAIEPEYFDIGRLYLKNDAKSGVFSSALDADLLQESPVLRAESYSLASEFYTNTSKIMKLFFNIFFIFFLCVIAAGVYTTIKMNISERLKEFGSMRAIGYSRLQTYLIVFYELFFLSLISLLIAFVLSFVLVLYFSNAGIYVGPGVVSFVLGGESFFPFMKIGDVVFSFAIILLFSLISTLYPGLQMCYQNITDLMLKRQKRVPIISRLFNSKG
ncbi:ABC transporter permease [Paenibacillus monticola]|uniref:FtsX-like permease family protein n=1 Tax=Paenibacillus monticola TaxID=2666075 RepID=A0A7X2H1K6_9BACL|nr:FtsX-like permease family protein [Paenibacillus monticola]MRN51860.1 FtsX-like permease family protein [Paenibacillus monticola]